MVAVELHGGQWRNGRHNRGAGLQGDCEKANAAVCAGWRLLTYTTSMLEADVKAVVEQVRATLGYLPA